MRARATWCLVIIILVKLLSGYEAVQAFYFKTLSLPEPRQMYGTAVLGDYLYVIGGDSKAGVEKSVLKALILPDGTLWSWSQTTPLPHPLMYIGNTTMVLHDVLYVVGGYDPDRRIHKQTILWTRPKPNGELEPWKESTPFPGEGIDNSVVVSTPGHIHLIGGYTQRNQPTNVVWSAVINDRGDFVSWKSAPPLPVPLWFHNAAVVSGRVWVWGGLTTAKNTSVNALVYSAPVLADGTLGQWRNEPFSLPKPFYSAACTSSGPYLLSFCPRYAGGTESNDIWFAEITERGISPWQKMDTDLKAKLYLGVATDFRRGVIFLPGGRITYPVKKSLDETVYVFRLTKKATEPPDARVVSTITIPDESSNLPHLSFLYLREKPKDAFAEFLPYEVGREKSLQTKLPLIVYFHSPTARPCETQRQVLQQFNFANYKDKLIFTWVDTTLFPQLVQQMGVFKVPCWIYFDASGNELKRKVGIINESELQSWLFGG